MLLTVAPDGLSVVDEDGRAVGKASTPRLAVMFSLSPDMVGMLHAVLAGEEAVLEDGDEGHVEELRGLLDALDQTPKLS